MSTPKYFVGFSHKNHFFARGIKWFTRSEFSHCYLVQDGPQGRYVLEANHRGVNLQMYAVFLKDGPLGIEEYEVDHSLLTLDKAWATVSKRRLNRPYSYWQILGDAFVITMQTLFKKSLPNPFSQRKADVCSELVLVWLRRAEISGFKGLDPNTVSPEELVRVVRGSSQFSPVKSASETPPSPAT